jgi:uncharacterized protein (TIGR00297 family)
MDWIIGLAGSLAIAGAAYWKRSLSGSGLAAAAAVGTVMYALGSAVWFGTLIAFFVSSTLLTRWKRKAKELAESAYEKSGRRDAGQVLANGGIATILCAANAVWPHPFWWYSFLGVMAAVTADTWATEIGGFSRTPPRSILTGKPVPPGTSGGVSGLGLAATMAGGLFIGAIAWLLLLIPGETAPDEGALTSTTVSGSTSDGLRFACWAFVAWIGGTIGSLADSLLGATYQLMYRCEVCGRDIEQKAHCGHPARRLRGFAGWNNDAVNIAGSAAGGAAAIACAAVLGLL